MDSPAELTAEMCGWIAVDNSTESGRAAYYAVRAIEDGRTVVVERRTEAEWRNQFAHWADKEFDPSERGEAECAWSGYINALRSLGLVRGE